MPLAEITGAPSKSWRRRPGFAAIVEREVPRFRDVLGALDRRRFLQLMAASMALGGLSACGPEPNARQLLPYVEQPSGIVPGRARYYATATTQEGYATGVLVAHQMARPVKVEGNPDHPASLGAASAIMQASILDPLRSASRPDIVGNGQIDTWESFRHVPSIERRERLLAQRGDGLAAADRNRDLALAGGADRGTEAAIPGMRWHQWEPLHRDNELAACARSLSAGRSTGCSTSVPPT